MKEEKKFQWVCSKCGSTGKLLGNRVNMPLFSMKYCGICDQATTFNIIEAVEWKEKSS